MNKATLKLLISVSLWGAQALANNIPMIGIDKDGTQIEVLVPKAKYQENLKKAVFAVQTTALPILQKKSEKSSGWMLRSAVFGLGVNPEVGIGELKFGFLPRFRIGFSNAKEPSVP
jgi:hypothetical protein